MSHDISAFAAAMPRLICRCRLRLFRLSAEISLSLLRRELIFSTPIAEMMRPGVYFRRDMSFFSSYVSQASAAPRVIYDDAIFSRHCFSARRASLSAMEAERREWRCIRHSRLLRRYVFAMLRGHLCRRQPRDDAAEASLAHRQRC